MCEKGKARPERAELSVACSLIAPKGTRPPLVGEVISSPTFGTAGDVNKIQNTFQRGCSWDTMSKYLVVNIDPKKNTERMREMFDNQGDNGSMEMRDFQSLRAAPLTSCHFVILEQFKKRGGNLPLKFEINKRLSSVLNTIQKFKYCRNPCATKGAAKFANKIDF